MKVYVVVALFAFVAVQLCQAAPAPDEEIKEEVAAPASEAAESSHAPTVMVAREVKPEKEATTDSITVLASAVSKST